MADEPLNLGAKTRVRKLPLFSLPWNVTEEEMLAGLLVGCPNGGPVAVLRGRGMAEELRADVFSQAGAFLRTCQPSGLAPGATLCRGGAGWTHSEILVMVTEDGQARCFLGSREAAFALWEAPTSGGASSSSANSAGATSLVSSLLPTRLAHALRSSNVAASGSPGANGAAPSSASSSTTTYTNNPDDATLHVQVCNCSWGGGLVAVLSDFSVLVVTDLERLFGDAPLGRLSHASSRPTIRRWNGGRGVVVGGVSRFSGLYVTALAVAPHPPASASSSTSPPPSHAPPPPPPPTQTQTQTPHHGPTLLIALSDRTLLRVTHDAAVPSPPSLSLPPSVIVRAAVSPNQRFWAVATRNGDVQVLAEDLRTVAMELDSQAKAQPTQLVWMGDDAVAGYWPGRGLLVIGPESDWVNYEFGANAVLLIGECDGARVFTRATHELLQRVPASVEAAFRIGSFEPAALLLDAAETMAGGDVVRGDEAIRGLGNELPSAVMQCIKAALSEFDVDKQQLLLRTAATGKAFVYGAPAYERRSLTRSFLRAAAALRVLNVVRHHDVGIPVTHAQVMEAGGYAFLVQRLALRGFHFVALRAVDALSASASPRTRAALEAARRNVVAHWAVSHVERRPKESDDALFVALQRVLAGTSPSSTSMGKESSHHRVVSAADLACEVALRGRALLAKRLALAETEVSKSVGVLMALGEPDVALRVAATARDRELVAFAAQAASGPNASAVLRAARDVRGGWENARFEVLAEWRGAWREELVARSGSEALVAQLVAFPHAWMEHGSALASKAKAGNWTRGVVEEQRRLVTMRAASSTTPPEAGASVVATIRALYKAGRGDEAATLIKAFRVSEPAVWHARLDALVSRGEWALIPALATERPDRAPVVVAACAKAGQWSLAETIATGVSDVPLRVECLVLCRRWGLVLPALRRVVSPDVRGVLAVKVRAAAQLVRSGVAQGGVPAFVGPSVGSASFAEAAAAEDPPHAHVVEARAEIDSLLSSLFVD